MTDDTPIITLALCESEQLILKPGVLYRFEVRKGCERCEELAGDNLPPDDDRPTDDTLHHLTEQQHEEIIRAMVDVKVQDYLDNFQELRGAVEYEVEQETPGYRVQFLEERDGGARAFLSFDPITGKPWAADDAEMDPDLSHLTDEQHEQIIEGLTEQTVLDCNDSRKFLYGTVRQLVERMTPQERVQAMTDDPDARRVYFDFDPVTGQPWPEEAD